MCHNGQWGHGQHKQLWGSSQKQADWVHLFAENEDDETLPHLDPGSHAGPE